jgi:DNA invertase Pin-like site-specific DNA recombinase
MKKKTADKRRSQPKHCAIYARTASVKQASEDNSIAQQVAKCKRYAKRKGWIVREDCIFTDSGKSGLTVNSGLKDLLIIAAVKPKMFDVMLCTRTDRIGRDTSVLIRAHETLKQCGVEIRFAELGAAAALELDLLIHTAFNATSSFRRAKCPRQDNGNS